MRIYPESFEVIKELNEALKNKKFEGRVADNGVNLIFLASMVANAGDGDHIEIGALFGASAIIVALMKKKLGIKGDVYCIDPYDAEERTKEIAILNKDKGGPAINQEHLCATPEALKANAALFDIDLKLIHANSDPWPDKLKDNVFVTAYVDGDHRHDTPYKDFVNLSERVSDFIGFDNYEEGYPDVMGGVNKAMAENENWVLFYKNATFAALRRRFPSRGGDQVGRSPVVSL